jgi:hypothetical protein
MKTTIKLLVAVATLLSAPPVGAAVPDVVTYSGRLTDGTAWGQSTQVVPRWR